MIAWPYTLLIAPTLDILDQALIARLRADGRAPVAALAKELHAARGTIQSRIARLVAEGVIRRFTVEVDPGLEMHTVRALTMIQLTGATPRGVRALLRTDAMTIPERVDDDGTVGTVSIGSTDKQAVEEARRQIELIMDPPEAEVGKTYDGKVVNITKFGAFVNLSLIHISEPTRPY